MNALKSIPVLVEAPATRDFCYQNTLPLLHEISHALRRLQQEQLPTTIDLNAIPFGPGDEQRLLEFLGRGEVSAHLEALGNSSVWESGYPGIWFIEHRNESGERVAFQMEITTLPAILATHPDDITESLSSLQKALENPSLGHRIGD